jgi:hypothetical protein
VVSGDHISNSSSIIQGYVVSLDQGSSNNSSTSSTSSINCDIGNIMLQAMQM